MKKLLLFATAFLLLTSCVQEEQGVSADNLKEVEVVTLDEKVYTRSGAPAEELRQHALKFRDQSAYERIVAKLSKMSIEEKQAWFKGIGFEGAYTALRKADNELDSIFDIESEENFLKAVKAFKSKYADLFVYNDSDKYDLSPYLPFSDEKLELVGNIEGVVKIGDRTIKPKTKSAQYYDFLETRATRALMGPVEPHFLGYKESSLKITQGKYQSRVLLGVDRWSNRLMIRFSSQKKKALWTRRHPTDYTLELHIGGHHWRPLYQKRETSAPNVKYLSPDIYINEFNGPVNCSYKNFHSGACSEANGNKDFTLDLKSIFPK